MSDLPSDFCTKKKGEQAKMSFREIFSGKGRLTQCIKRFGRINVDEPVEYLKNGRIIEEKNILNTKTFRMLKEDAARPGQTWHFGLPCGSFSILQHSNKGTRRRYQPAGDGTLLREIIGNEMLRRTIILIKILERNQNFWTLENPASSYVWAMPSIRKFTSSEKHLFVYFDQCRYGLRLKDEKGNIGPCKKPTRMLGNLPGLDSLHCVCVAVKRSMFTLSVGSRRNMVGKDAVN